MKGEEITEPNLTGILSIIGADCECGLDVSWTQGTPLPIRWDGKLHAQAAKMLGFDPESPIVKLEASRIIGERRSSPVASTGSEFGSPAVTNSTARGTSVGSHSEARAGATRPPGQAAAASVSAQGGTVWRGLLFFMAGMAVLTVTAGLCVVLRVVRNMPP
jgi:hypothetical protein